MTPRPDKPTLVSPETIASRMVDVAEGYLRDEALLSKSRESSGHGAAMLGLIGLEIYLKAAVLLRTGRRPGGHDLGRIWSLLDENARTEILDAASERVAGHHEFDQFAEILKELEIAFVIGRYSYEVNDKRNPDEACAAGNTWVASGADSFEADIAYFPMERFGLVEALRAFCSSRLTVN